MSLFPDQNADDLYFSMDDSAELMSRNSQYQFDLEGHQWRTVEHYYQAMKFDNVAYQEKIRNVDTAAQAKKLGNACFKNKRSDLDQVRIILMTRAIYIQAKTHNVIANRILATGKSSLVKTVSLIITGAAAATIGGTIITARF